MFGRKSIKDIIEDPKEEEYYILVTRYYPRELRMRGLKLKESPIDEWDRDLAPSKELLKWWKSEPQTIERWKKYEERFSREVPDVLIRRKIQIYKERALNKRIIFVCIEKDEEYPYCHTWILLNILEKTIRKAVWKDPNFLITLES